MVKIGACKKKVDAVKTMFITFVFLSVISKYN